MVDEDGNILEVKESSWVSPNHPMSTVILVAAMTITETTPLEND